MNRSIDILGLGYTAVDDLLYLDHYPAADGKAPVRRHDRQCGGLTATALVAAARLGCRCAYAGTLGEDEHSRFVIQRLREEGIDTSDLRRQCEARPVRSTIVVDQGRQTRTIFYDLSGVTGPDAYWPPEEVIRKARLLLVDHCGIEGMIRAAQIARRSDIPVVADFENTEAARLPEILSLVDHLILPRSFAESLTGETNPNNAVCALWSPDRCAAVVTCGRDGCWFVGNQQPGIARHQPAFSVEAVDTTGCGDVFHGAYAAALVRGMEVAAAVQYATITAGLKAARQGGQAGIPTATEVDLEMRKSHNNLEKA